MNTTNTVPQAQLQREGIHRLAQVAAVLYQAQHELLANPDKDVFGLTLGDVVELVDDVLGLVSAGIPVRHQTACDEDPLQLLREAEVLLTGLSIKAYPPGTSDVLIGLIDAARGLATRRGLPYPPPEVGDE